MSPSVRHPSTPTNGQSFMSNVTTYHRPKMRNVTNMIMKLEMCLAAFMDETLMKSLLFGNLGSPYGGRAWGSGGCCFFLETA